MQSAKSFLRLTTCFAFGALLLLSACEIGDPLEDVDLVLDVDDAEVELDDGVAVQVSPDRPAAQSQTINNDLDVAAVEDLRTINLAPSYFSFTGTAGKSAAVQASGAIDFWIFIDGIPLPGAPITLTIEQDVVTDISPTSIDFGGDTYTVDEEGLSDFLASLSEDERPDVRNDWASMTMDEVRAELNEALSSSSFPVALGIEVTSSDTDEPLVGSLQLERLSLDARVRKSDS